MRGAKLLVILVALVSSFPAATAGVIRQEESEVGILEISSEPEGASVYIEGFMEGVTPLTRGELPPGEYRVVFKSPSYADFVEDVEVVAGQTVNVSASLSPGETSSAIRAEDDYTPVVGGDQRKPYEDAKAVKKLREYETLEIANFLVRSEEPLKPEHLYPFFQDLAKGLEKRTEFRRFVTAYTRPISGKWVESNDSQESTLVLSGVITEYEGGSRAKRYLVGFGAGKTRAYCLFRLVDKETGEVVFERMENGSVSMGVFGGTDSGAMSELGDDIGKAIDKNW